MYKKMKMGNIDGETFIDYRWTAIIGRQLLNESIFFFRNLKYRSS